MADKAVYWGTSAPGSTGNSGEDDGNTDGSGMSS